jgi:hypothetical protein
MVTPAATDAQAIIGQRRVQLLLQSTENLIQLLYEID